MPEKQFRHDNGKSSKFSQLYKHMSSMDTDELIDELADKWDAMDEKSFDPELIDVYLDTLERKGAIASDFNAEDSLAVFHAKQSHPNEQMEEYPKKLSETVRPPKLHRRFRIVHLIAIVVAVAIACIIIVHVLFLYLA